MFEREIEERGKRTSKKFKVNKLVRDQKKNTLGTISEKEPESRKKDKENPDYDNFYYVE